MAAFLTAAGFVEDIRDVHRLLGFALSTGELLMYIVAIIHYDFGSL
jgi:hypothetical protein